MLFDHSKICKDIAAIPLGHVEPETVKAIATALAEAIKKSHGMPGVESWPFHAYGTLKDVSTVVDWYSDETDDEQSGWTP